jgi:TolB protein
VELLRRLEQDRALALGTRRSSRDRRRDSRALVALLALVACGKSRDEPKPKEPPHEKPSLRPLAIHPNADRLPGTLWFTSNGELARLARGKLGTSFNDVGAPVFPSRFALPDGRIVGIASKGTGDAGSEQLVLVGHDIARIGPANTQVRNPAVDPAGKWIVIEGRVEPHSELYKIDLATQEATRLTNNKEGNFTPAVLGDAIVFASSRDGDSELYKLAGEKQIRLTAFHRDDWSPQPSPDGKTIAFLSDREGKPRVCLIDADGTKFRRLTKRTDGEEADPLWSPDGKSILYTAGKQLVLHELATGNERELGAGLEPAFSPDGTWLAVIRADDIWVLPTDGTHALQVTMGPAVERLPRWL